MPLILPESSVWWGCLEGCLAAAAHPKQHSCGQPNTSLGWVRDVLSGCKWWQAVFPQQGLDGDMVQLEKGTWSQQGTAAHGKPSSDVTSSTI